MTTRATTAPGREVSGPSWKRPACWAAVAALTAILTIATTAQALVRYRELRSGWSWDLAYYNQWYWALTQGDGLISVRPISSYATEGPSIWKMNYLAPIRLLFVPVYLLFPDPRTLLVIQSVVFWWVVPASYSLVRAESKSDALALSAAALVPWTPLLWPLVWNDFRELQLALPFVLWGVQGVRGRDVRLTAVGVGGMLACRQEYALVAATFAALPPRQPEDLGRTARWAQALVLIGLGWLLFGFFGYLKGMVGRRVPELYVEQFLGPKAGPGATLATACDLLVYGLGAWAVLAFLAPRVSWLALPWIWGLCGGRWALRFLAAEEWHHVRYTAPIVALVLAGGLVGYARLGSWLLRRRGGGWLVAAAWIVSVAACCAGLRELNRRLDQVPRPMDPAEAQAVWYWIGQVGPADVVLAAYDVSAPLSSRRYLYSNRLEQNRPKGYPKLGPEFRWAFLRNQDLQPQTLLDQGFAIVHRGPYLTIYRREGPTESR